MKVGLIGLGLSGKTTLFNAVTGGTVEVGSYQSRRDEVHRGRVLVPDERVDWLTRLYDSRSTVYAEVEYIDVACFGGDGERRTELEIPDALRECDALAHVVRAFDDPSVIHPKGSIDVRRDIVALDQELIFADLLLVEKRFQKVARRAKLVKDDKLRAEYDLLKKIKKNLDNENCLRNLDLSPDEEKAIRGFHFLSRKPLLILVNLGEDQIDKLADLTDSYSDLASGKVVNVVSLCGKIEMELAQLPSEDRQEFMDDLGLKESALDIVIKKSYVLLGLISFITAEPQETRAWTTREGSTAPEAAGVIHEDFERGFIRAEVVPYDDLHRCGSKEEARKQGLVRLEGKNYVVVDGDVILFRFNV